MADGLEGFAGSLFDMPTEGPAYGGGYGFGVDTALRLPEGLSLPGPIEMPTTPLYQRAFDVVGKVGSRLERQFTASPLKAFSESLGLGATGFGIANQLRTAGLLNRQTQQIEKSQKAAQAAAAPAVGFGQEQLAAAQAGKLPGPMESFIEQWKQQAKADARARLAAMGLGNSSDITAIDSQIDLMGESMKAQLLQGQEQLGLAGLQTGVSAATGGGQIAQEQQALLTNLIAGANQQLARLGATG